MPSPYAIKPPRVTLVNVATAEILETQLNPSSLDEALGANFAKLTVPGLSHQRKHFVHTEDDKFTLELFNHCFDEGKPGLERIMRARTFLRALVHPRRNSGGDRDGAPRVLFIWPGFISLVCRATTLSFKYGTFDQETGTPTSYTATLGLEEQRDAFVGMEDVLDEGKVRDFGDMDVRDFGELD